MPSTAQILAAAERIEAMTRELQGLIHELTGQPIPAEKPRLALIEDERDDDAC